MTRTEITEADRKSKLFSAWIEFLIATHATYRDSDFTEFFEGLATVSAVSNAQIDLKLENSQMFRHIAISPAISKLSCREDLMFVILGQRDDGWRVLDVISIGSHINSTQGHITYNPLHVSSVGFSPTLQ